MSLIPITNWSLQSPDGTVWVPSMDNGERVTWTPGGAITTSTPPVFQGVPDTVVHSPSISNLGEITLTSTTSTNQRWAALTFGPKTLYFVVDSTGTTDLVPALATVAWSAVVAGDLAGYKVYYGRHAGSYIGNVTIGVTTSAVLTVLNFDNDGKWYFAVSSFDTSNNESAKSSAVSKRIIRTPSNLVRIV